MVAGCTSAHRIRATTARRCRKRRRSSDRPQANGRGPRGRDMRRIISLLMLGAAAVTATALVAQTTSPWPTEFAIDKQELSASGRNPYFVLEPGYVLQLEGGKTRLTITVLDDTLRVDGVDTRVVEERETENGALIEVSRNFFAISTRSN